MTKTFQNLSDVIYNPSLRKVISLRALILPSLAFGWRSPTLIAQSLGMMKAALEDSIAWAIEREIFGKSLIKHQIIRHKTADMSAKIDAVESYMYMICWNMEQGEAPVAEISKAKFFTKKALELVASEAMQILGGAGYLRGCRVECIYSEVKVMAIGDGSEEIMRDLAVRHMGL